MAKFLVNDNTIKLNGIVTIDGKDVIVESENDENKVSLADVLKDYETFSVSFAFKKNNQTID